MLDITAAGFQLVDFRLIDIESQTSKTRSGKRPNQGETDLAKADDTDARLFCPNQFGEPGVSVRALLWRVRVSSRCH